MPAPRSYALATAVLLAGCGDPEATPVDASVGGIEDAGSDATATDSAAADSAVDSTPLALRLSVDDPFGAEGTFTSTSLTFTVSLSSAPAAPVSVDYATANNTATAGALPGDYLAATGTLTFLAGETAKTVTVTINGDFWDEDDETLVIELSNPTGAIILDGQGSGTITDDDPLPALTIDNVSAAEGNAGSAAATFTISLSPASGRTVTVSFATADGINSVTKAIAGGTASSGGMDYASLSGTVTFAPFETTKPVTVTINSDVLNEVSETFFVNLSGATNATLSTLQGRATIENDDPLPSLSIDLISANEGNSGFTNWAFAVRLSPASGRTVTVQYSTSGVTATDNVDFDSGAGGTLTFAAGTTMRPANVTVFGDTTVEGNELFNVLLAGPTNATIATNQAAGIILNDD